MKKIIGYLMMAPIVILFVLAFVVMLVGSWIEDKFAFWTIVILLSSFALFYFGIGFLHQAQHEQAIKDTKDAGGDPDLISYR